MRERATLLAGSASSDAKSMTSSPTLAWAGRPFTASPMRRRQARSAPHASAVQSNHRRRRSCRSGHMHDVRLSLGPPCTRQSTHNFVHAYRTFAGGSDSSWSFWIVEQTHFSVRAKPANTWAWTFWISSVPRKRTFTPSLKVGAGESDLHRPARRRTPFSTARPALPTAPVSDPCPAVNTRPWR